MREQPYKFSNLRLLKDKHRRCSKIESGDNCYVDSRTGFIDITTLPMRDVTDGTAPYGVLDESNFALGGHVLGSYVSVLHE